MTEQPPPPPANKPPARSQSAAGIALIVFLAIVFIALLVLVIRASRDETPDPGRTETSEVYVVPLGLRLRAEPNTRSEIIATVQRGTKLTLLEMDGAWARVRTEDGQEAWTDRNALESATDRDRRIARAGDIRELPPLEGKVLNETQLYAGPGLFYPVIGRLDQGASVRVFTRDHEFYAIDLGDGIAYAEVQAVELSDQGGFRFDVAASDTAGRAVDEQGLPEVPATDTTTSTAVAQVPPRPAFEEEVRQRVEPEREPEPRRPARSSRRVYGSVPEGGTPPELMSQTQPEYPAAARRAGIEGAVILRAVIQRDGSVTDVDIVKDLPLGLGDAARRSVRNWRFRPATLDGTPIATYYTITVNYRLQ